MSCERVCAAKEVCKPLGSMFLAAATPQALGRAPRWQDACRWEEECQHLAAWACLQNARGEEGQGGEGMETEGGRSSCKKVGGKVNPPTFRVSYREAGILLEGAAPPPTAPLRRAAEVTVACVMVALCNYPILSPQPQLTGPGISAQARGPYFG